MNQEINLVVVETKCRICLGSICATSPSEKVVKKWSKRTRLSIPYPICNACLKNIRPKKVNVMGVRLSSDAIASSACLALKRLDYPSFFGSLEEIQKEVGVIDETIHQMMKKMKVCVDMRNRAVVLRKDLEHQMLQSPHAKYLVRRKQANDAIRDKRLRDKVFSRDGFKCRACQRNYSLAVDHVRSVFKGGSDDFENLQTLCCYCNSKKGSDDWEWLRRRGPDEPVLVEAEAC